MKQQTARSGLCSVEISDGGLKLVLNNTLAAIEDGRRAILRFLGKLDPAVQNRLELLFEELVSNTIRHGFARNSNQSIHLLVECQPGAIRLTFEDDGIPFNPLEAEMPGRIADIETARVGGLGIPLIVKLSTGRQYERPASGKTGDFQPNNRTIVSVAT